MEYHYITRIITAVGAAWLVGHVVYYGAKYSLKALIGFWNYLGDNGPCKTCAQHAAVYGRKVDEIKALKRRIELLDADKLITTQSHTPVPYKQGGGFCIPTQEEINQMLKNRKSEQ